MRKIAKLLLALGILTGVALGGGIANPPSAAALGGTVCTDQCYDPDCTCVIHCHSVGSACVCAQNACLPFP